MIVINDPPFGIKGRDLRAISIKEKQDMANEFLKFSLEVSINLPVNSALSENAIAWITKSNELHLFFSLD